MPCCAPLLITSLVFLYRCYPSWILPSETPLRRRPGFNPLRGPYAANNFLSARRRYNFTETPPNLQNLPFWTRSPRSRPYPSKEPRPPKNAFPETHQGLYPELATPNLPPAPLHPFPGPRNTTRTAPQKNTPRRLHTSPHEPPPLFKTNPDKRGIEIV